MKHFKNLLVLMLVFILGFTSFSTAIFADNNKKEIGKISKVIYEDSNKLVVETTFIGVENLFMERSIMGYIPTPDTNNGSHYPEGRIMSESKLYKKDIEEYLKRVYGARESMEIVKKILDGISNISGLLGYSPIKLATKIIGFAMEDLQGRTEQWWEDSLKMLIKGEISYVKITMIENVHDYPKVYTFYERV